MATQIDTKQIAERSARMREANETSTMDGFLRVMEWKFDEGAALWATSGGDLSFRLSHAYEAQLEINHTELLGYVEHLLSERKEMLRVIVAWHDLHRKSAQCVCTFCTEHREQQ